MNAALMLSVLVMGLAGSLHCAGMCGPIVWMMPFHQDRGWRRAISIGMYHLGRLSAYAVLGLVLFSFKELFHPQWQQYVSLLAGLMLLALGVFYFLPQLGLKIRLPWTGIVTMALGKVLTKRRKGWLLAAGLLNGLLPCGMVYMALAAALNMETAGQAAAVMYAFGAGTLPMMVSLSLLRGKMRIPAGALRKWTPVIMLLFGCLFVLRGANLGIPYLSPKLEMHTTTGLTERSALRCCQKAE
ncbi:MAG: sulfite exporter TauE/SafE family protein [Bacteroidetes bacterium]|nr:sulfite exporter TauE/SafE family protein [Bacteroidota bacterium]MBS1630072.1 sulfite exporter TauE/SafE family protein [Bacteroidota bacterium]